MIHNEITRGEKRQIRYTYTRLESLRTVIAAARSSMEGVAMQMGDKYLRRSILTFVAETSPCEQGIKKQMSMLAMVFPLNDLHSAQTEESETVMFTDPFECAMHFEKKTTQAFRMLLNDFEIMSEVRNLLQQYLNEMLYAYLKIKLLNSFSIKELSGEKSLF